MKLNNKILSSAAAVLAAVSLGLITSQTVNAQSITLHKGYDKTATPYIRQKGEFIHANKSIKIKNYKFFNYFLNNKEKNIKDLLFSSNIIFER